MKLISWNLLRLTGASVEDVAQLTRRQRPDLLLMQEATTPMDELPRLVGGHYVRHLLPGRIHGPSGVQLAVAAAARRAAAAWASLPPKRTRKQKTGGARGRPPLRVVRF